MKNSILFCFAILICQNVYQQEISQVKISENLEMTMLSEGIYQYTSYLYLEPYGMVGENGLVVLTDSGAVIIDTPWDNELSQLLINYVESKLNSAIKYVVVTHSHADCAGGLEVFKKAGVKSVGHIITRQKLLDESKAFPEITFTDTLTIMFGNKSFEIFYPGAGHTVDNITVSVNPDKILFGGCLLKASENNSIGNVADADIDEWPASVQRVQLKYTDVQIVVPGHGSAGTRELFQHTLDILGQNR